MDNFEINNPFSRRVADDNIRSVLDQIAKELRRREVLEKKRSLQISVALVGKRDMARLNRQYRKKEGSTDVLSFCYDKTDSAIVGEVVLSPEVIEAYAKEDGTKFESELEKNLIHGILHIVGFEHGDEMFLLQDKIFQN